MAALATSQNAFNGNLMYSFVVLFCNAGQQADQHLIRAN